MASLNGVSSSNTVSSLMNSANMISGLASGLDTESMIENLVKSYQTKIESLNQKVTKTEWKQDAYRSIISKMVGFSSKYTSYTSGSNLTSPSFFNRASRWPASSLQPPSSMARLPSRLWKTYPIIWEGDWAESW